MGVDKLHKRMVALGDLSQHTYDSIAAQAGEPKEKKPCVFSDIGEGTRATWSDGIFTITLNFDADGKYCGIYHHRNWEPYIWLAAITAVIVAAALIVSANMRKNAEANAETPPSAITICNTINYDMETGYEIF